MCAFYLLVASVLLSSTVLCIENNAAVHMGVHGMRPCFQVFWIYAQKWRSESYDLEVFLCMC